MTEVPRQKTRPAESHGLKDTPHFNRVLRFRCRYIEPNSANISLAVYSAKREQTELLVEVRG